MSWSVSAAGTAAEVRETLAEQFKYPQAEPPAGIADEGERATVRKVSELLEQILATFGPEQQVVVTAHGHIGFADWTEKSGGYQTVNIAVQPK